ncbi:Transcriptional activator RfaH [Fulvivirga imtechensis AK7]|uniref:Transcriptional activator RfaH n=1 Tax=Fulvivirga imtechensis AK7 TaxID=1237149 RepID=L8JXW2_9BACT|nr:UpxY family transcription antiterminator [Fulvivirga imtechensis]ELR72052.1 Transcriptional activator RfaH [Fulvivirga imtechensis AK7]
MPNTKRTTSQPDVGNDLSEPDPKTNWYIFYTAPRAEKVVQKDLLMQGYDVFLPITKTLRVWNNRQRKVIDQVLFPSYIFVNTEESQLHKICQTRKVATFIHCGGKPSKVNRKCIEGIKRMLDLNQEVSVEPNFSKGEKVQIISGPLAGYEGVLLEQQSKTKFGIRLKEINQTVFIDICKNQIRKKHKFGHAA